MEAVSSAFGSNDTTAESITYTATDTTDSLTVTQTGTATFTAGVPQVSQSNGAGQPNGRACRRLDGVHDHGGSGGPQWEPGTQYHDHIDRAERFVGDRASVRGGNQHIGSGRVPVTDSTAEVVRYRATDTTDNLRFVGEEVQVAFGTPPPTTPVVADSDIVASSTMVPADGHSSATVEVILNDDNGLPLAGKSVALVPSSVNAVVSPAVVSTGFERHCVLHRHGPHLRKRDVHCHGHLGQPSAQRSSVTISFTPSTSPMTTTASAGRLNKPVVAMAGYSRRRGLLAGGLRRRCLH